MVEITFFNILKSLLAAHTLTCIFGSIAIYLSIVKTLSGISLTQLPDIKQNLYAYVFAIVNGMIALYALTTLISVLIMERIPQKLKEAMLVIDLVCAVLLTAGISFYSTSSDYTLLVSAMVSAANASSSNNAAAISALASGITVLQYSRIGVLVFGVLAIIMFLPAVICLVKIRGDGKVRTDGKLGRKKTVIELGSSEF